MVALNETISEPGLRRAVPHCRVAATCPQGTSQIPAGTTNYLYYTSSWQLVEVRTGGTAAANVTVQMVWSAAYINAPVLQDTYSAGVVQPNSRLYFTQDANWNTTAVIGYNSTTQTWNVVQRYVYSPYGNITILNPDFTTAPAGTVPMVNNLYQGMPLDPVTGLYYERARWYSPSLGTWISQDPAGYINGAVTYQFVMGNPVGLVDPTGLLEQMAPGVQGYIGSLGQPGSGPLPWGLPVGGNTQTNINNQVVVTTYYPGGGVQSNGYRLTPAGPAPLPGGGLAWFEGILQAMASGAGREIGETEHCLTSTGGAEELTPKERGYTDIGAFIAGGILGGLKYAATHPYYSWSNMAVPTVSEPTLDGVPWSKILQELGPSIMPGNPVFPAGQRVAVNGRWT